MIWWEGRVGEGGAGWGRVGKELGFFQMKLIWRGFIWYFYQDQLEYQIEQMRKAHQLHAQTRFLPSIPATASRKELAYLYGNHEMGNSNNENHFMKKLKLQPVHHCLVKRDSLKATPFFIDELLEKKLSEKEKADLPTQPKTNRPWAAREVDQNKITARPSRMRSILACERKAPILRKTSCQNKASQTSFNQPRMDMVEDVTTRLEMRQGGRGAGQGQGREKIKSCKIAMRRGGFPMDPVRFQRERMVQFFEQEEVLSTIGDRSEGDNSELFMSFSSYLGMDI